MRYRPKARARLGRLHNAQRLEANARFHRFLCGLEKRKGFPRSMVREMKPNLQTIKTDDVIGKDVVHSRLFHIQASYTIDPKDLHEPDALRFIFHNT